MQSVREADQIRCHHFEYLPGDPGDSGGGGALPEVLMLLPLLPRSPGHSDQAVHSRAGFVLNVEGAPWKLQRKDLTMLAQTWSVLSHSNFAPTSHTSDLNMDKARLVYELVMKMNMDVGAMISSQIAQSNSSKLGFLALITALC